ncbi:MAG: SwmB domain-containing protein [Cyclobacteriaceae bacterium]
MKYTIKTFLIAAIVSIIGCTQDEDFDPKYSGIEWYSTLEREDSLFLQVGDKIDLLDLSLNPIDHKWIIGEGSFFLRQDFTENDSIYDNFIIADAGLESTSKEVSVLFTEPGKHTIRLFNTFKDSVAWFSEETDTLFSKKAANGLWEIDTTFVFDIFDKLNPAFKVFNGDTEVLSLSAGEIPLLADKASWPVVEVEVGGTLRFVDLTTTGRPTSARWGLNIGPEVVESLQGSEVELVYTKLGEFAAGTMTSVRNGSGVPVSEVARVIPMVVKGIPSSQPFVFNGNLREDESEVLSFSVTGEVAGVSGEQSNFTVHVKNGSFDQAIEVQSTRVNSSDATVIELVLAEPIYNSDTITVAYAGGNIKSLDTRPLKDFGPQPVTMYFGNNNLLEADWAGFETPQNGGNQTRGAAADGYWVGRDNDDNLWWTRVEDFQMSGVGSMKFESPADGISKDVTLQGSNFKNSAVSAGTYLACMHVFLEVGNTLTSITRLTAKYSGTPVEVKYDLTNVPRGEWVSLCKAVTFDADNTGARFDFRVDGADNPSDAVVQKMYIDDQSFIALEVRP